MKTTQNTRPSASRTAIFILMAVFLLTGPACTFSLVDLPLPFNTGSPPTQPANPTAPTPTPVPSAETAFTVKLPAPLQSGETLAISILDEVTGLALNAVNYPMQAVDAQTYTVSLPLALNSVVKYRYILLGDIRAQEVTSANVPVRYRLYQVSGPGAIQDTVTSWTGQPFSGATGHIQGLVLNAADGSPLPNILVTAGGVQTLSDSSGRFYLEGLPPGIHMLVAYAMDGSYQTFQQGAQVEKDLITPVQIHLGPAPMVKITFIVDVPKNTVQGAPVRMAGNLLQLGNTFGDLNGGLSTVADRMPTLTTMPDGRYTLTMQLPAGADLRYKYTLGDGFWNAEHKTSGEYRVRRLVVPQTDAIIQDTVETWQAGPSSPILFDVTVPANTPAGDIIYIQFYPYGWTEPIPMWPMGNNRWTYKLYGPLNILGNFGYRYCRNAQCGSADDIATTGNATTGRSITTSLTPQDIQESVTDWAWMQNPEPSTLVAAPIQARTTAFVAGVEFQPTYAPNWSAFTSQALQNIQALGSNWVVLTPTWTYTRTQPLVFTTQAGKDPLWSDNTRMISQARALNLNVALFPAPNFPAPAADWWRDAPRDPGWWEDWFDRYRQFALHHADLAARNDAQTLILGGDWLAGGLVDGEASGVPADADVRWQAIISDIRARFNGAIWWALPYTPGSLQSTPAFLENVDGIYLLWEAPLSERAAPPKEDMIAEAGRLLDEEVSPFQVAVEKPVILALAVPSATGTATACLPAPQGGCLDWMSLSRPNADIPSIEVNLQAQTDVYESMLTALNERAWLGGFISRGYYPPAMLQDKSASVHGKPAADLLWYWFPRLLGIAQ
ncbi:MAG: carboxypeptidase regulatory-like domain-containing protein [Chloroflexi bacterium]|nr:carboxypeptidase regulatory-like domain-containing protein [Chloroflexota bacterium]